MFDALSAAQLEKLAGAGGLRTVRPREILYEQDAPAPSCFVVLGGAMRVRLPATAHGCARGINAAH